jgi:hypothetical protein
MVRLGAKDIIGFNNDKKWQKEIVDGLVKKRTLRDAEISRINRDRKKSAGNFW